MLRSRRTLVMAWLLAATLVYLVPSGFAQTSSQPGSERKPAPTAKAKAHSSKKTQPVAEVPQAPPPPPTLEQQPPVPPQVTYRDGQLTINSTNATLSQVLHSVQAQTGAVIDIPPGAGSERVVATLGPGKPQNVLSSLLNGSKFNYVILGEPRNPGAVQKVILLAKTGGASGEPAVAVAQNNPRLQAPPPQQGVEPPEDEYPQNDPEAENNQNQLQPGAPGFPGSENLQPDVVNPGNRTPEQMLEELQRMQQQQQQMQQQLNPANQQPPPQQPFGQPFNQNPQAPQQFPNPPQAQPR